MDEARITDADIFVISCTNPREGHTSISFYGDARPRANFKYRKNGMTQLKSKPPKWNNRKFILKKWLLKIYDFQ